KSTLPWPAAGWTLRARSSTTREGDLLMPESVNPGCGVAHYVHGENHTCRCHDPYCTGFDHVCLCGWGWSGTVRTRFLSFDPAGVKAGDPCRTRIKISWD